MSVEERNQLVVAYLWCIDCVIRQNYNLVLAAHLDRDNVYRALAMRLIRAIELYHPGAKNLKSYIFMQLKYELLNCKSARAWYGLGAALYNLRGAVVSLDALIEAVPHMDSSFR